MVKYSIEDLACFGGQPAFAEPLHVGRPNIGNRERFLIRVNDMLDRRWLTNNGPYVRELEARLAEYLDVKHCIAITNCTVALEITISALGLTGEVIIPAFTFVATAHALQWREITPVFCDIDIETHNLNPKKIASMITPRTTGIIGVHVWGRPCAVDALEYIAGEHKLALVFDAAHALGSSHNGRMIGNFGNAEAFSFHATKFFNSFEGGAITTNDDTLAEKVRLMRNFGFAGQDNVIYPGTNGKMSEISAAMGLTNFESIDQVIDINRRNYRHYGSIAKRIPGVEQIVYNEDEANNYQYVIWKIDDAVTGISRDHLVSLLHAEKILARRYFHPGVHQMEPYRSHFPHAGMLLPATEQLTSQVMSLPTGSAVGEQEIDAIGQIIAFAVKHSVQIDTKSRHIDDCIVG